ncbi:MAG TPA: response regulator transcription factor [Anaerolineae bacterium]|nr:response regulator transcription factor [Anaerolineae bacterium]
MSSDTIRVVVVDDHPLVRTGLCTVLGATADIVVAATGANGADALRLVDEHRPAVLVLDVNLPDLSGMEVTRRLCSQAGAPAILILTVHNDSETLFSLLEAGAAGYVLKDDAAETLADAVRAVARGASWLSPQVARQVVHRALNAAPECPDPPCPLTPREMEVLRLLAQGLDNDAIAAHLTLTTRTVQNHVSAIYGKLGVASRAEAILYAIRHQLAPAP